MLELYVLFCVGPLGWMKESFRISNHHALGSPGKWGKKTLDFFFMIVPSVLLKVELLEQQRSVYVRM